MKENSTLYHHVGTALRFQQAAQAKFPLKIPDDGRQLELGIGCATNQNRSHLGPKQEVPQHRPALPFPN